MQEAFASIVPAATVAFAVSSMLAVGLAHTPRRIVGPLRHPPGVIRALAANFVLAPALAWVLARVLAPALPHRIGLFLAGAGAGAPFLLKLTRAAKGDVAFAASLLVLLLPLTVLYLPVMLPTVFPATEVSAAAIARPLVLTMLLPLAAGLALRPLAPRLATRARRFLGGFSTAALIVLLGSIVIANWQAFLALGWRAVLAACAFTFLAFTLGWALGGRTRATREVVALGTAQRNIAAATVVATRTFGDEPGVVVMVAAVAILGMAVLFPVAFALRARSLRSRPPRRTAARGLRPGAGPLTFRPSATPRSEVGAMETLVRNWWAIALRGAAAILFGIMLFAWPAIGVAVLVALFGAFALVDGVFALVAAVRRARAADRWLALALAGITGIVAGIAAFVWPGITATALLFLIGAWAIVVGMLEIVAAVELRKEIRGEFWLGLAGALSVLFGLLVFVAPAAGAVAIVWWIGAYAMITGVAMLALAFRLRGLRHRVEAPA